MRDPPFETTQVQTLVGVSLGPVSWKKCTCEGTSGMWTEVCPKTRDQFVDGIEEALLWHSFFRLIRA